MQLAGDAIPEVGGIIKGLGSMLELKNERDIINKLRKINQLIRDDQKNLVAKYVASKLTIKRRTYISSLTDNEIQRSVTNYEKLQ